MEAKKTYTTEMYILVVAIRGKIINLNIHFIK